MIVAGLISRKKDMARVQVSKKVYEVLVTEYSRKYGGSSGKLHESFKEANRNNVISYVLAEKTIRNFFDKQDESPQNSVLESTLNALCKLLLTYDSYIDARNALDAEATEVTRLVNSTSKYLVQICNQEWLQEYAKIIDVDCQTRILDMSQPRKITDIFVEVRMLGTPKRQQQKTLDELMQLLATNPSGDRLNTDVTSDDAKITGFQAIETYEKLMILGRPGAGKTTFLKQVANITMTQLLISQDLNRNPLPIYIRLKDFSESGDELKLLNTVREKVRGIDIKSLLEQGKCKILLDALDEVIIDKVDQVYTEIGRLINKYPKNSFVVTCRNAAREYLFENFTLVEIAEFNNEQIEQFVSQWFREEPKTAEVFLTTINNNSNQAVLELAGTPLMLTFLCLTFDAQYGLTNNRHELYGGMVNILSRRWDASRRIHREMPYSEGFTQQRLIDMLAKIAYDGFTAQVDDNGIMKDQPQYFWKRWQLEEEIGVFTQRIFGFEAESESESSAKLLKAVEANTGIFVEEVRDTYKFAHLTFQEYFTGRYIALSGDPELLRYTINKYLMNPQWKEVFRVIPGRLRSADQFFLDMFWKINTIARNTDIPKLLNRLDIATQKHRVSSSGWRAMYLATVRNTYYIAEHGVRVNFRLARRLATEIKELNKKRKHITPPTTISLVTTYLLIVHSSIYQQIAILDDLEESHETDMEVNTFFDQGVYKCLESAIQKSKSIGTELAERLIYLKDNLPGLETQAAEQQEWLNELTIIMRDYLDIGRIFDFTKEDTEALNSYLYACNLLVDCIGGDSLVSPKLRNQIIDNLLLPQERIPSELLEA